MKNGKQLKSTYHIEVVWLHHEGGKTMKKPIMALAVGVIVLNIFTSTAQAEGEGVIGNPIHTGITKVSNTNILITIEEMKKNLEYTNTVLNSAESLNQEIIKAIEESRQNQNRITKTSQPIRVTDNMSDQQKKALVQQATSSLQDIRDLQEKTAFQGYNVNTKTHLTPEQLDKGLSGTGLAGLGKYFYEAEQEWNVSSLALAGIAANESAWGTSNFAKTRHNYYGYQAYDSNPDAAAHFDSPASSINAAAKLLAVHYLEPAGQYYNGVTLWGINVRYASDVHWADKATKYMNDIVDKINQ